MGRQILDELLRLGELVKVWSKMLLVQLLHVVLNSLRYSLLLDWTKGIVACVSCASSHFVVVYYQAKLIALGGLSLLRFK